MWWWMSGGYNALWCIVGILFFGLYACVLLHCPWLNAFISGLDCPLHLSPPPSYRPTLSVSHPPQLYTSPLVTSITLISLCFLHHCLWILPLREGRHTPEAPAGVHLHTRVLGSELVTCEWRLGVYFCRCLDESLGGIQAQVGLRQVCPDCREILWRCRERQR